MIANILIYVYVIIQEHNDGRGNKISFKNYIFEWNGLGLRFYQKFSFYKLN